MTTYGTYDRVVPKEGEWERTYRVSLRTTDTLDGPSEIVTVVGLDGAHAALIARGAKYVKNFRAVI
jgi:hypothetical protein